MTTPSKPDQLRREKPTFVRFGILMLACMTSWFLYLHRYSWNIVSDELGKEFGFSKTELGGLYSFFSLTYGFGQIPSGIVSDFFGPHFFLSLIIVAWSAVVMLFTTTGHYGSLAGVQLGFGACQAGAYPNLTKVTETWFPQRTRTIVQGLVATFFGRGGGAMSSIIMVTLLMGYCELSWRVSLLIMGGGGIVFGLIFFLLFRNSPDVHSGANEAEAELIREGRKPRSQTRNVLPVSRAVRNKSLWLFVFQQWLNAGADVVFLTFMGSYFLDAKGVELATGGILVSLPLWGGAVGGLLGGFCNDVLIGIFGSRRWGRSTVGFVGKFLACILMFVVIAQNNPIAAGLALFAVKFFSDWSQPTVWGTCTDLGGRYSATVFSILNTSGTLGGLVFPPLFGLILDANTTGLGDAQETNYAPMFTLVAIMYIGCAVCWLFINSEKSLDETVASA